MPGSLGDVEEKYKRINARLQRLLTEERRALATVRKNYGDELKARGELEMLLRECIDDCRKEIALSR